MKNKGKYVYWVARLIAAFIMLQTLYYKFSGAEESIYIFTTIGFEPWGRIGIGVMELIASILLIVTPFAWLGGLIGMGLMFGAIGIHLTLIGLEVKDDGGYLFFLAIAVLLCSVYVLWVDREKAIESLQKLKP